MRTKELRPLTEYATENGSMIRTFQTVERGWYSFRQVKARRGGKGGAELGELEIQQGPPGGVPIEGDPWGEREAERRGVSRDYKQVTEGIRVMLIKPDRDGKGIESSTTAVVIDPKHIKGTWAKYMELHGDKVRLMHDKHEAEKSRRATEQVMVKALSEAKVTGLQLGDMTLGSAARVQVQTVWKIGRDGAETETTYPMGGDKILGWRLQYRLEFSGTEARRVSPLLVPESPADGG